MGNTTVQVKQHDYGQAFIVDFNYRASTLNLTDAIAVDTPVVFIMTPVGTTTPLINRVAAAVTNVDPPTRTITVAYEWRTPTTSPLYIGDTATPGRYRGEFEFTLSGGAVTAPTGGYLTIDIIPDLG